MLRIESNLKINGRYWGLAFTDGVAHTANISLAAKLLLKGYVVTDQPEQAEAVPQIIAAGEPHPDAVQEPAIIPAETTATEPAETPKPKTTKSRKRAVNVDAADESGV